MIRTRLFTTIAVFAAAIVPASADASSSYLECRGSVEQLDVLRLQIESFNEATSLSMKSQHELLSNLELKTHSFQLFFGEEGFKSQNSEGVQIVMWHESWPLPTFRPTSIEKDGKPCAWVSYEYHTTLFELLLDEDGVARTLRIRPAP